MAHRRGMTLADFNREQEELNLALALSASMASERSKKKASKPKTPQFLVPPQQHQINPRQSAIYGRGELPPPPSPFIYRSPNTPIQMQNQGHGQPSAPPNYEVLSLGRSQFSSSSGEGRYTGDARNIRKVVIINHPPTVWTVPYNNQVRPNNAWVAQQKAEEDANNFNGAFCCCIITVVIIILVLAVTFTTIYVYFGEFFLGREEQSNLDYPPIYLGPNTTTFPPWTA